MRGCTLQTPKSWAPRFLKSHSYLYSIILYLFRNLTGAAEIHPKGFLGTSLAFKSCMFKNTMIILFFCGLNLVTSPTYAFPLPKDVLVTIIQKLQELQYKAATEKEAMACAKGRTSLMLVNHATRNAMIEFEKISKLRKFEEEKANLKRVCVRTNSEGKLEEIPEEQASENCQREWAYLTVGFNPRTYRKEPKTLFGFTPLHLASYLRSPEAIQSTLEEMIKNHGPESVMAALNSPDSEGNSPLDLTFKYSLRGREKLAALKSVELLLKNGANPNFQNTSGESSFMRAVKSQNLEVADLMHKASPINLKLEDQVGTIFHWAIKTRQKDIFKFLTRLGNPLEIREILNSPDRSGEHPLYSVFPGRSGYVDISWLKLLLENGADPNLQGNADETLVYRALNSRMLYPEHKEKFNEIIELLASYSASLPLHFVANSPSEDTAKWIELFSKSKLDYSIKNHEGRTAFHDAIRSHNLVFVEKALRQQPATIHVSTNQGETATQMAEKEMNQLQGRIRQLKSDQQYYSFAPEQVKNYQLKIHATEKELKDAEAILKLVISETKTSN